MSKRMSQDEIEAIDRQIVEVCGNAVVPSAQKPGRYTFAGADVTDGMQATYPTKEEAFDAALLESNGEIMGQNDLSSEEWDEMPPRAKLALACQTFGVDVPDEDEEEDEEDEEDDEPGLPRFGR